MLDWAHGHDEKECDAESDVRTEFGRESLEEDVMVREFPFDPLSFAACQADVYFLCCRGRRSLPDGGSEVTELGKTFSNLAPDHQPPMASHTLHAAQPPGGGSSWSI